MDELVERLIALGDSIEGVTLSGGEPLQQFAPVLALLRRLRQNTDLSTLLFTGYTWPTVRSMPRAGELLACLDVVIAGPYRPAQRLGAGLRGSSNQTVHLLTGRYQTSDLEAAPSAEVVITEKGELLLSGVDPLQW